GRPPGQPDRTASTGAGIRRVGAQKSPVVDAFGVAQSPKPSSNGTRVILTGLTVFAIAKRKKSEENFTGPVTPLTPRLQGFALLRQVRWQARYFFFAADFAFLAHRIRIGAPATPPTLGTTVQISLVSPRQ